MDSFQTVGTVIGWVNISVEFDNGAHSPKSGPIVPQKKNLATASDVFHSWTQTICSRNLTHNMITTHLVHSFFRVASNSYPVHV